VEENLANPHASRRQALQDYLAAQEQIERLMATPPPAPAEDLLSIKEVADQLGISVSKVEHRWRLNGGIKVGGNVRFRQSTIDALKEGRVQWRMRRSQSSKGSSTASVAKGRSPRWPEVRTGTPSSGSKDESTAAHSSPTT